PRVIWNDQLFLAERLAPHPALIPDDLEERALMFGLANEICGENGIGWNRRLMLVHTSLNDPKSKEAARKTNEYMAAKYGYSPEAATAAPARVAAVVRRLSEQLERQRSRGSTFLIGGALSALDIYWAAFAARISKIRSSKLKALREMGGQGPCAVTFCGVRRFSNDAEIGMGFSSRLLELIGFEAPVPLSVGRLLRSNQDRSVNRKRLKSNP